MTLDAEPCWTVLVVALVLDVALGEPPNAVHPVAWMGKLAALLARRAPRRHSLGQLAAGALIAIAVPLVSAGAAVLVVARLASWPVLAFAVSALLLKATFALRGLGRAAFAVRDALACGDLPAARHGLRSLCSRDPSRLAEPELVAAAVESVAENTSDSFVAPLFYYVVLGLPGAIVYRAINTLDAMIGYRGRYEYLGKAAARLDDALNFVPARITAALLLVGGWLCREDVRSGWCVLRRDGHTTESPNAGRPMAAMAGLLRVQLEKPGHYRLGDASEPLEVDKIGEAWRVAVACAGLAAGAALTAVGVRHVAA
jgi:adenosylcobinamide-phosphate synthase